MAETLIIIQQGVPTILDDAVTFLGIGSAGDPEACRRLVFPAGVTPLLAPIDYVAAGVCLNPDATLNLDNLVLRQPRTQVVQTLGNTRLVTFGEADHDVIVTEIWDAAGGFPTVLWRQFYEYWINQPAFELAGQPLIVWEPRDRTTRTYTVEIVNLSVGGLGTLNVRDVRSLGGSEIQSGDLAFSPVASGVIDEEVRLEMRVVAEVI